jgi:hypothetical protein
MALGTAVPYGGASAGSGEWSAGLAEAQPTASGPAPIFGDVTIQRMDNVGIVVDDLDAAVAFFTELGMELEGRMPIEGSWAGNVVGLDDMRSEIAMMRIPDAPGRLELLSAAAWFCSATAV